MTYAYDLDHLRVALAVAVKAADALAAHAVPDWLAHRLATFKAEARGLDTALAEQPKGEPGMNDHSDYGRCENCDNYANLQRDGFCVGCIRTLLTDGTYLRSGWTPKQQLTITSLPRINMNKENQQ